MLFKIACLAIASLSLGQTEAKSLSSADVRHYMSLMDTAAVASMKTKKYEMSKKQEKALKKLLDQEHDRFNAMDIDEDGKVYWLEFKEYWR